MNNLVMIAAVGAEKAAREASDQTLEGRLLAAMKATRNHWMATNEDDQFLAACEGAARACTEEEKERIEASLRLLSSLAAASSGVPVDFSALLPKEGESVPEPLGLRPLWESTVVT